MARPDNLSIALLLLFAFRHYGYEPFFEQELWGDVFKLAGAACLIVLVAYLPLWLPLKAWVLVEELMVAGCSSAWLVSPQMFADTFPAERCSQAVGVRIGAFGLVVLALVAYHAARKCSIEKKQGEQE